MSVVPRVLTHLTMFASAAAAVVAFRATRSGLQATRPLAAITAVLASVYAAAYAVLLFWVESETARVRWSDLMRGVSLVTWVTVWAGWPWLSIRLNRRALARLDELAPPDGR